MALKKEKRNYRQEVTDELIAQIEKGTAPWQKPWEGGICAEMPHNPITKKIYHGMNSILLDMKAYKDPRWLTYKQALSLDAQVRKGEKGTQVEYWKWEAKQPVLDENNEPVLDDKGNPKTKTVRLKTPTVFRATVFNAEQIDGLEPYVAPEMSFNPIEEAEKIIKETNVEIEHRGIDRACYNPFSDNIQLPPREAFKTAYGYYETALHELGHATGHKSRLNRDLTGGFGSISYAKEELRAEIASYMIAKQLGIGHDPSNHASYVESWLKVLREDKNEIFRAARDAEKACQWILSPEKRLALEKASQDLKESKNMTEEKEHNYKNFVFINDEEGLHLFETSKEFVAYVKEAYDNELQKEITGKEILSNFDCSTPEELFEKAFEYEDTPQVEALVSLLEKHGLEHSFYYSVATNEYSPTPFNEYELAEKIQRNNISLSNDPFCYVESTNKMLSLFQSEDVEPEFKETVMKALEERELKQEQLKTKEQEKTLRPEKVFVPWTKFSNIKSQKMYDFWEFEKLALKDNANSQKTITVYLNNGADITINLLSNEKTFKRYCQSVIDLVDSGEINNLITGSEIRPLTEEEKEPIIKEAELYKSIDFSYLGLTYEEQEIAKSYKGINVKDYKITKLYTEEVLELINSKGFDFDKIEDPALIEIKENTTKTLLGKYKLKAGQELTLTALEILDSNNKRTVNYLPDESFARMEIVSLLENRSDYIQDYKAKIEKEEQELEAIIGKEKLEKGLKVTPEELEPRPDVTKEETQAMARTYLNVPFTEKNEAKELGAKWDKMKKSWYVKEGVDLDPFKKWQNENTVKPEAKLSPQEEFSNFLKDHSFEVKGQPVMDGKWQRCPVTGDKKGKQSGSYIGFTDGTPNGQINNFKTGKKDKWTYLGQALTPEEKKQLAQNYEQAKKARKEELQKQYRASAKKAYGVFEHLKTEVTKENCPYLAKKQVNAYGVKVNDKGDLVIPARDAKGFLWSIQTISEDKKGFLSGSKKSGMMHVIDAQSQKLSDIKANTICITEGYATGATVYEATKAPVVVAFDAYNLKNVAKEVRQLHPEAQIIICADNDKKKEVNTGLEKAKEAAEIVNAKVIAPTFTKPEIEQGLNDFNDLAKTHGLEVVTDYIGLSLQQQQKVMTEEQYQKHLKKLQEEPEKATKKPKTKERAMSLSM